jgi:glycosyltransferase involved in cell wall biosynthesis
MPEISVVMPVRNALDYVHAAIDSILAQTFRDFEFIIVDDSTDATSEVLREYARRDPRIRVIPTPSTGVPNSLNAGIAIAAGTWIARMDADDIALPQRFERQMAFLAEHPDCDAAGALVVCIDADGSPIYEIKKPCTHAEIDALHLQGCGGAIVHPTAIMRRSTVQAIGGYNEQYRAAEDIDFFLRFAEHGRLANQPEVLLYYRLHASSSTFTRNLATQEYSQRAIHEAYERRGLGQPPEMPFVMAPFDPALFSRNVIRESLGASHFGTARKHAWRFFRAQPGNWHAAGYLLLSLVGPLGSRVVAARANYLRRRRKPLTPD